MTMSHIDIRKIGSVFSPHHFGKNNEITNQNKGDVGLVMKGHLLKQKNMKRRFFVLRQEMREDQPARLECYNSEKKFICGYQPKKAYILKECFNISQKTDKNSFVIALYINKACIGLVAKNEVELKDWLHNLQCHRNSDGEQIKSPVTEYEHVWPVEVLPSSLASTQNLVGQHWLCLTNQFLFLVRMDNCNIKKEFQLSTIRKCGSIDKRFFLQLGQYSVTGRGVLFMQTESSFIAKRIHTIVGSHMTEETYSFKRDPNHRLLHSLCAMNNFRRTSSMTESDMRKRTSSDLQSDEDGVYVPMDSGGSCQPPSSFGISLLGGNTYNSRGVSIPLSTYLGGFPLWRSDPLRTELPSPQTSTGSTSSSPLLDHGYVPMSPGTLGLHLSQKQSGALSHYLEMGPGPSMGVGSIKRQGPSIPQKSCDDSCYVVFENSACSSCSSETRPDDYLIDVAGDVMETMSHCN